MAIMKIIYITLGSSYNAGIDGGLKKQTNYLVILVVIMCIYNQVVGKL